MRKVLFAACAVVVTAFAAGGAMAHNFLVDLTHPIPTFKPMEGDAMKPDMNQPWLDSKPIPSFGQQTVFSVSQFTTNQGYFDLGLLVLSEHHGTHLDTSSHYLNNAESMESVGMAPEKRRLAHEVDANDLMGPMVLIDISGRVQRELDKNGGKPSPDKSVTDFSESSPNVVTVDDIAAIEDKLVDGSWLVLNLGWSRFYFSGTDFGKDPYINGFNHPGLSHAAVDKLVEIIDKKGVRLGGIVADNIGIDSGEAAKGVDDKWTNSWYAHVRLFQRGVLFVENATNLDQLAMARPGSCTLIVGAPKHVRGTGGPSRVMALCYK